MLLLSCAASTSTDRNDSKEIRAIGNASMLRYIDRIGTANAVTNFGWWDSLGRAQELRSHYGQAIAILFWNSEESASIAMLRKIAQLPVESSFRLGVAMNEQLAPTALRNPMDPVRAELLHRIDSIGGDAFQQVIGTSDLSYAYDGVHSTPLLIVANRSGRLLAVLPGDISMDTIKAKLAEARR